MSTLVAVARQHARQAEPTQRGASSSSPRMKKALPGRYTTRRGPWFIAGTRFAEHASGDPKQWHADAILSANYFMLYEPHSRLQPLNMYGMPLAERSEVRQL